MKRLIEGQGDNSPQGYNQIFKERVIKGVDEFDLKRWRKLLKYYKGGSLIDIGALDSLIIPLARAKDRDSFMLGIDTAKEAMEAMQNKYGGEHTGFEAIDLFDMPKFTHGLYKYAVMGEVLEHMDDPQKTVDKAIQLVAPGGVLAISVPFNEAREPGAVDGHRHLWSFDKKDIHSLLSPYGYVRMTTLGSQWFPYKYHFKNLIAWCFKK